MAQPPKRYFLSRIGQPIPFRVDTRGGRREFEVTPRGADGTYLLADVCVRTFDQKGMQTSVSAKVLPAARFQMSGYDKPGDIVEAICREADPDSFRGQPAQLVAGPFDMRSVVGALLSALDNPANRGDGEAAPTPESSARLMRFLDSHVGLVPPAIFSSRDGSVRARWQHGADRTLHVGFPPEGPLPMTISFPKIGNYGLVKVNARVLDDDDVPQFAAQLGVRITRGA